MRRFPFLILAFSGLASAQAQAEEATPEKSIRALRVYAWCVVNKSPSHSRRILSLAPGSHDERALLRDVSTPYCTNGQGALEDLTFEPQLLRGAIAEEVLGRDIDSEGSRKRGKLSPPFASLSAADIGVLDEKGRQALRALDFAQCVVAAAPKNVSALLQTDPTTLKEARAFAQLAPVMGPCLPQGAQLTIVKPQMRGFLAEASYRAAYAAATSGSK